MVKTWTFLDEEEMQGFMNHFVQACDAFGLEINLRKTIVIYDPGPRLPYGESAISVEGKKLDVVHFFL